MNPGSTFPDVDPERYARVGMHQEFRPDRITTDWFKLLVIREPLDRFISAYNFFRFEMWRDTLGAVIDLNVTEFVELTRRRNSGDPIEAFFKYPRGYISSLTSLNAEQQVSDWRWTNSNIFDVFDEVIDTTILNGEFFSLIYKNTGLEIHSQVHVNISQKHLVKTMGLDEDCVLRRDMLSSKELAAIESLPDYQSELDLWERYLAYRG
jgi:hypothetical protein